MTDFKIGSKVRCLHNPPARPEDSIEFQIAEIKQGDGVFTQSGIVYACGPSLHTTVKICWPIDRVELIG
jgi:hypothetical protein